MLANDSELIELTQHKRFVGRQLPSGLRWKRAVPCVQGLCECPVIKAAGLHADTAAGL